MADATIRPRDFAFALGTFHACTLLIVVALLAYSRGGLGGLERLNTAIGLAAFGVLWAASVYATGWALRGVHTHHLDVALSRGIRGGIVAAWVVVATGVVSLVLVAMIRDGLQDPAQIGPILFVALFYATAGALVGAIVGGAIGFLFAIVDWFILQAAGIRTDWAPSAAPAASTPALSREVTDD
jgi:hypothetical protein